MSQQGQRFRRRALRRGYKVDEVDEFLERVEATLAGQPLGAPVSSRDVHDFVFRVRFGGYDEWQVDMHLDRVERQLAAFEEGGGLPAAEPAQLASTGSAFALPPGDPNFGAPHHDPMAHHDPVPQHDPMPHHDPVPQREGGTYGEPYDPYAPDERPRQVPDEPTMVRPGRASASVPPSDPAPRPTSGGPTPAGRGAHHTAPPPQQQGDFTQKLPPLGGGGYEPGPEYPSSGRRFDRETQRYEDVGRYEEPNRYEDPNRYEPEPPRFAPEQRYDGPRGGYDQSGYDDRRYEPEPQPPRFEPATGEIRRPEPEPRRGYDHGYEAPPQPANRFETGFEPGRHGKIDMTTEIPAVDSPFTPDDLHHLEQVRRTFQVRRFGSGYDPQQVNRLFDAIAATMSGRASVQVSDSELDPGQFSLVQGGLFEAEVDGALRDVRDMFARRGIAR